MVPRFLTAEPLRAPVKVCLELKQKVELDPDEALTHCDLFLFQRMKKELKELGFDKFEDVQEKSTLAFKGTVTQDYADSFNEWKLRLQRCTDAEGEYFEGDSFD